MTSLMNPSRSGVIAPMCVELGPGPALAYRHQPRCWGVPSRRS